MAKLSQEEYVRRVFETALFFRDMHEEGGGGHTKAIELLKPIKSIKNAAVRQFVLHELYKKRKRTLTEVAVELAAWQPDGNEQPPFTIDVIESELRALCLEHERDIRFVTDKDEIKHRSFLRAARYIQRIRKDEAPAHSRVVEFFIPDEFVWQGIGINGSGHREHVVPCVYLLEMCLDRFDPEASLDQVAHFLQRYVVIVEITKDEQKRLDGSENLKNSMPKGWQPDTDCIFKRLHKAKITFELRPGSITCNCNCNH